MSYMDIEVDAAEVTMLMWSVRRATSAVSMMSFLENVMVKRIREQAVARFASEGDQAVGGPWEQLRPATVTYRQYAGFPGFHPINRRTGEMERYITGSEGRAVGAAGWAELTYPGSPPGNQVLGRKVYTAQAGWKGESGQTNPRPVLAWATSDLAFGVTALEGWILAQVANPSVRARL